MCLTGRHLELCSWEGTAIKTEQAADLTRNSGPHGTANAVVHGGTLDLTGAE